MNELTKICQMIYEDGTWPDDFMKSMIIPLEKKPNATDCGDFRTISLIAHASKILLKIMTCRLEAKCKDFIGSDQFGFRKGKGTREAIASLRCVCERSIEHDQDVFMFRRLRESFR